ncbi:Uma2 family endonuclease [Actinophytocola sp.]|uniref:Uma2 family endonuclease n=1 Tax=Actinophytocola sp. TaxID=1872138 RepID=UPI002D810A57|nr:Uma2 family endonuclease [Actinophytocola sp.]HET9143498.1 Uma2 family endonuclease [Actinophytocola sp.]
MGFALTENSGPCTHSGYWTIQDVEALPDHGNHARYEILAPGVLTVSPAPAHLHQRLSLNLAMRLVQAAPPELEVVEAVNVEIPGGMLCQPDIVVIDRAFADAAPVVRFPPHTVRAVVEIVSPNSKPQDRLVKPQLYAAAKIPVYWRVEMEKGPQVIVSELRRGRYVQVLTAVAGARVEVPVPFRVELDPAELVGRAGR